MYMVGDPPTSAPAWFPVRTEDTTALVGATPMAVKRVWLKLADGSDTHLDIPVGDYNAATVRRLADQLAANHFEVMSLRGPEVQLGG